MCCVPGCSYPRLVLVRIWWILAVPCPDALYFLIFYCFYFEEGRCYSMFSSIRCIGENSMKK